MKKNELNKFALELHKKAKEKGFWIGPRETGTILMLIVSELAEALEAHRKGKYAGLDEKEFIIDGRTIRQDLELAIKEDDEVKFEQIFRSQIKDTFEDEIADTFIRLFDYVGYAKIDIDAHIRYKMLYNRTRSCRHGKKY